MESAPSARHRARTPARRRALGRLPVLAGLAGLAAASCGGGGSGGSGEPQIQLAGRLLERADGSGPYYVDPHHGGDATRMQLVEVSWGRLVDVHDVDAEGRTNSVPVLRDFVVDENALSDGLDYELDLNAVTGRSRLIVHRTYGAPDDGTGTFEELLTEVSRDLPPLLPRTPSQASSIPPSVLPRNACAVLRFDDLLLDGPDEEAALAETVRLLGGYPPVVPLQPRLLFDENHGGTRRGRFHSTRILVDTTISQPEAADMDRPLPVNEVGLPESRPEATVTNAVIELPVELDVAQGQLALLRNASGSPLDPAANGPYSDGPVRSIQRAFRTGNPEDANNGFLIDVEAPRVIGEWPVTVEAVRPVAGGDGLELDVDLFFPTLCALEPVPGDIVITGMRFLEVLRTRGSLDAQNRVADVRVRSLATRPPPPSDLLGGGSLRSPYRVGERIPDACWVRFTPAPGEPPASDVSPQTQIVVLYSEALNPSSFDAIDSMIVVRGPEGLPATGMSQVVGRVDPPADLRSTTFVPSLPFAHLGDSPAYTLYLLSDDSRIPARGLLDLAGNALADVPPPIEFGIDPAAPFHVNGGITQRFEDTDELPAVNRLDFRGNVFLDFDRGVLKPRPVGHTQWLADRSVPVPSLMIPFPPGIQTPLTPLGSKLQTLWRYADLGWQIRDETKYDLDVTGVYWSPNIGTVNADFYPEFEMRLSHSRYLPDEQKSGFGVARFPASGLGGAGTRFEDNVLVDPMSPQTVVHARELGYRVDPADVFIASSGTPLIPWPMNRGGGPGVAYTWRDTSVQAVGGQNGAGVPLSAEANPPLSIEQNRGSYAPAGQVPSIGLPLLMEFRCYPTSDGLGLNPLAILLAINTSAQPNFRAYSTGGVNTSGRLIRKNPDLQESPNGGFNPGSSPPGQRTAHPADNTFYIGALDTVVRVSRGNTMWIDTTFDAPRYVPPTVLPRAMDQPLGTSVTVEFRGADSVEADPQLSAFNALGTDPYGNLRFGEEVFHDGVATWTRDVSTLDGARYVQLRYTFLSNVGSGVTAELDGVALAFSRE